MKGTIPWKIEGKADGLEGEPNGNINSLRNPSPQRMAL